MKKILLILFLFLSVSLFVFDVHAQGTGTAGDIIGTIKPPEQIGNPGDGASAISTFIQRVIQLIYTVGTIGFIFMILWGGLQIILNAGDKEAIGSGRKRIVTAIAGIALLALAFPILRILEGIIGIKFFF